MTTWMLAVLPASASTGALEVTVRDAATAAPLPGVRVTVGWNEVRTDGSGLARFDGLDPALHTVAARAPDRYTASTDVSVRRKRTAKVDLALRAAPPDPTRRDAPPPIEAGDVLERVAAAPDRVAALDEVAAAFGEPPGGLLHVVDARIVEWTTVSVRAAIPVVVDGPEIVLDGAPLADPSDYAQVGREPCSRLRSVRVDGSPVAPRLHAGRLVLPAPPDAVGRRAVVELDQELCIEPWIAGGGTFVLGGDPVQTVTPTGVMILGRWLPVPRPAAPADFLVTFDVPDATTVLSTGTEIGRRFLAEDRVAVTVVADEQVSFSAAVSPHLVVEEHRVGDRPVRIGVPIYECSAEAIADRLARFPGPVPPLVVVTGRPAGFGPPVTGWPGWFDLGDAGVPCGDGHRGQPTAVDLRSTLPDARTRVRTARLELLYAQLFPDEDADPAEPIRQCIEAGLCDAQGTLWIDDLVLDGSGGAWSVPPDPMPSSSGWIPQRNE